MSYYLECLLQGSDTWVKLPSKYAEPLPMDLLSEITDVTGIKFRQASTRFDWNAAKERLDQVRAGYEQKSTQQAMLALIVTFDPLRARYMSGERTEELYDSMMAVG